jgi:hypothetical protein
MEYYGLRKRGMDIDFIITEEDYNKLADLYPGNKKDIWGDMSIFTEQYEFFRSVYRFDYNFFAVDAHEYNEFKVISFEKLFLLKTLSFKYSPHVEKLTNDFHLMVKYYFNTFRNKENEEYSNKHIDSYLSAPGGVIYNDNYLNK